jgi:hypothetical protein
MQLFVVKKEALMITDLISKINKEEFVTWVLLRNAEPLTKSCGCIQEIFKKSCQAKKVMLSCTCTIGNNFFGKVMRPSF